MELNDYQDAAMKTAIYPQENALMYNVLNLASESGEVAGKIAKLYRGDVDEIDKEALVAELGDVLWNLAGVCDAIDIDLDTVALYNLNKLQSRAERDQLNGDGDDR